MKNITSEKPDAQWWPGGLPPRLRALRTCESRIRDLSNLRPVHDSAGWLQRSDQLRTQADSALRMAHACVNGGDFREATAATLAGMVNNFSKMRQYPVTHKVDAIMACLEKEVGRRARDGSLAHWGPQHLSLVANGFSKGQGACVEPGLNHLAQALLSLAREELMPRQGGWNARYLSLMVNGLGKGRGAGISEALAHLGEALPAARYLTPASGWSAQSQAMMANGLSKSEGPAAGQALQRLAQAVSQQDLSRQQGWTVQHLAMTTNALGKAGGPCVQQALRHLARSLTGRQGRPQEVWKAQALAMMTAGLGKGEGACIQEALTYLARLLPDAAQLTPEAGWLAQHLAMMASGLGKGKGPAIRSALVRLARAIAGQELTEDKGWTTELLVMTANGLSKQEEPAIKEALDRLAQAVARRHLTAENLWQPQQLVIMVNALSRSEGPDIDQALSCLAAQICQLPLTAVRGWSPSHLAMTANGLRRANSARMLRALDHLARAVGGQALQVDPPWTAADLAMMADGLNQCEGPRVQGALVRLAMEVTRALPLRPESGWDARHLAMMTVGLSRGEGREVQEALRHIAQTISSCDLAFLQEWPARFLVMLAHGLSKAAGAEPRLALARLAGLVCQRELSLAHDWTDQNLVTMLDATGQALAGHAVFNKITTALLQGDGPEPAVVYRLLRCLARFALSAGHLASASRFLGGLKASGFRPSSQQGLSEILWGITLCHFACQQQAVADQSLAVSFFRAFGHFLSHTAAVAGAGDDKADRVDDDHWHDCWVSDYWQLSAPVSRGGAAAPAARQPAVSYWQGQVFERLRKELPDHDVRQEVPVNRFPVDILIDGRICVEVDGPEHFVGMLLATGTGTDTGTGWLFTQQRRTKDRFIDHMLRRYGYEVFRIAAAQDPARCDALVAQVRAALDSPVQHGAAAVQPEPQGLPVCGAT